jgi:hypothetical protein
MSTARAAIPTGVEYLNMVAALEEATHSRSARARKPSEPHYQLIGTALSALYQAATCHRKCHGGPHILESLCGRMYNLGIGAYVLAERGLYDEALNLIRSIGEASNLIALSVVDKQALKEWLESDKKTRLAKFGPAKIRKALERQQPVLVLATEDWYARFCEEYTHVTPRTRPNMHNANGQAHVGGVYQEEGLTTTLGELATVLASVAMLVCGYFKLNDLLAEITAIVKAASKTPDTHGN